MRAALCKEVIAARELLPQQGRQEADPGHPCGRLKSGSGENRGRKILPTDQDIGGASRLYLTGPADDQRNMESPPVKRPFTTKQRLAIVPHENHNGIFVESAVLQELHHHSESAIQIADVREIARIVEPHFRQVGKVRRQGQFFGIDPVMVLAPGAVRLIEAEIEEERFPIMHFVQSGADQRGHFFQSSPLG